MAECIAEVNVDEAAYVGDGVDGVYIGVSEGPDGWYVSTVYVDALVTDDGPYPAEAEALEAGKGQAIGWCTDNGVLWDAPPSAREETDNLRLQVLEMATPWNSRHLVVERHDGLDGITWDQLQAAKNEALGPDAVAIEIYPAADDVVNEVNRRHLWEVPDTLLDGLTLRKGS